MPCTTSVPSRSVIGVAAGIMGAVGGTGGGREGTCTPRPFVDAQKCVFLEVGGAGIGADGAAATASCCTTAGGVDTATAVDATEIGVTVDGPFDVVVGVPSCCDARSVC